MPERTLAGASNAQAPSLTALRRFRLLCFHAGRLLVLSTAEVSHRPSLFFGPKDTSKDKMLVRACVRNPNRRLARRLARAQARLCSQALRKEVETAFEALELALHSAASLAPGLPSMVRCMLHAAGSMSHVVCCMLHVPCCMLHVPCCMLPPVCRGLVCTVRVSLRVVRGCVRCTAMLTVACTAYGRRPPAAKKQTPQAVRSVH